MPPAWSSCRGCSSGEPGVSWSRLSSRFMTDERHRISLLRFRPSLRRVRNPRKHGRRRAPGTPGRPRRSPGKREPGLRRPPASRTPAARARLTAVRPQKRQNQPPGRHQPNPVTGRKRKRPERSRGGACQPRNIHQHRSPQSPRSPHRPRASQPQAPRTRPRPGNRLVRRRRLPSPVPHAQPALRPPVPRQSPANPALLQQAAHWPSPWRARAGRSPSPWLSQTQPPPARRPRSWLKAANLQLQLSSQGKRQAASQFRAPPSPKETKERSDRAKKPE
jgi:hypothetical protein